MNGIYMTSADVPGISGRSLPSAVSFSQSAGSAPFARPKGVLVGSVDLDRTLAADTRAILLYRDSAGAVTNTSTTATPYDPGETLDTSSWRLLSRGNSTHSNPFVGTLHGFIWLTDAAIPPALLLDALYEPVASAVDVTGRLPRLLPDDGAVLINDVPVTPRVFLRGVRFDQFETSPGVWVVPNRGSAGGNLSLVNGAFT
jgi:hypothetical protein